MRQVIFDVARISSLTGISATDAISPAILQPSAPQRGAVGRGAGRRQKDLPAAYRKAHERLVDNPPWLYIVHDLNPRAMSPKVKGFVSPQSWFVDMTLVSVQ
jgi:ABC-type transport system substrate-binding protein